MIDIEALATPAFLLWCGPDATLIEVTLNAAARAIPTLASCLQNRTSGGDLHIAGGEGRLQALLRRRDLHSMIGDVALLTPEADRSAAWWASLAPLVRGDGEASILLGLCRCGTTQSESHLSLALQAIQGAEWRFDVAKGEFIGSGEIAMLLGESTPRAMTWAEWLDRIHPEDLSSFVDRPPSHGTVEFRFRAIDGGMRWAKCSRVPLEGENGEIEAVLGIMVDITPERVREKALIELATRDPLTGLLNRRGLRQEIDRLRETLPTTSCMALFAVDLDHFKATNDRHGHAAGDAVLVEAAKRLTGAAGRAVCARLGGDEFVAVVPMLKAEQAMRLRERLTRAFRRPLGYRGQWVPLSATIGVACLSDAIDMVRLLEQADADLYARKHARSDRPATAA